MAPLALDQPLPAAPESGVDIAADNAAILMAVASLLMAFPIFRQPRPHFLRVASDRRPSPGIPDFSER
jgi:hypothetical protein